MPQTSGRANAWMTNARNSAPPTRRIRLDNSRAKLDNKRLDASLERTQHVLTQRQLRNAAQLKFSVAEARLEALRIYREAQLCARNSGFWKQIIAARRRAGSSSDATEAADAADDDAKRQQRRRQQQQQQQQQQQRIAQRPGTASVVTFERRLGRKFSTSDASSMRGIASSPTEDDSSSDASYSPRKKKHTKQKKKKEKEWRRESSVASSSAVAGERGGERGVERGVERGGERGGGERRVKSAQPNSRMRVQSAASSSSASRGGAVNRRPKSAFPGTSAGGASSSGGGGGGGATKQEVEARSRSFQQLRDLLRVDSASRDTMQRRSDMLRKQLMEQSALETVNLEARLVRFCDDIKQFADKQTRPLQLAA